MMIIKKDKLFYSWTVVGLLWVVSMLNYLDRLLITSMRDPIKDSIAIMGISEACYIPAAVAMIMDYHKGYTRSLASGILMSGLYAGMALGGAGGYIAEYWGWRFGFHVFGVMGIGYAIVKIFILQDAPEVRDETQKQIKAIGKEGTIYASIPEIIRNLFNLSSYRIIILYVILLGMSFWLINAWLPTYCKDGFKLSLGEAGISATAFIQVASLLGVIVGGILADRWSRRHVIGRIFVPAIGITLGGPFLFLMASTVTFGIAIASITIFGLAKGFHDANFMPIICQVVDERYQATGYEIMSFFSVITGGIMIYIGGAVKDAGISLSVIFQIAAIGVFISGLLLFLIRPKQNGIVLGKKKVILRTDL